MKTVLVTGGAGYLGSVLCKYLLDKSLRVRCFDRLYFGIQPVKQLLKHKDFTLIKGNIADFIQFDELLKGVEAVIHLAGIANDPTAELDPQITYKINHQAAVRLAQASKEHGVKRFIFASSCSVYGKALADVVSEDSPINPVSVYAESKTLAERDILALSGAGFPVVSLRQATLYGVSPRMRFDLAINLMALHATTKGKIFIWGGGDQWRPFLHVEDAASAFIECVNAPEHTISGKIYNLGATQDNFKIIDLAKIVKKFIQGVNFDIIPDNPDKRSYRVNCDKITKELNWRPRKDIAKGIEEILTFIRLRLPKDFENHAYYNIRTMQDFIQTPVLEGGDPARFTFLPFSVPSIGRKEEEEVLDTLRSGWLTTGPKTQRLEQMFCDYLGCKHAICVNSCTAALHLSLVALGIKEGDEVITSPITWPATANVIVHCGATPVFVDVEPGTLNINVDKIEEKITKKTKAIIPVHMAGLPAQMEGILRIAKKYKLYVIEDAAHAIGAQYKGKNIGTISDCTCFSFYPIKNITTIEGGLVTTSNRELAERIKIYSLHGVSKDAWKRYDRSFKGHAEVIYPGFKYNMSDVQASLGLHQLPRLSEFISRRENISRQYDEAFKDMDEVQTPKRPKDSRHARHLYIIMLKIEKLKISRDELMEALKSENIGTGLHFRSLHLQPYYRTRFNFKRKEFPLAAHVSDRIVSLPLYPAMTQYDVDTVIKAVKKLIHHYRK